MPTPEGIVIENLFRIADKAGEDVDFKFNPTQADLDENLTGRDVIPKARQEGVSSYFLARQTVKCLHKRNTRAVVISHESEATQRMFNRVKYFLEHLKGDLKAVTQSYSKNEITFPKTGSMFYIGTAGAKKFGRGDTITDLHCSEVAFWPEAKDLLAGLFQAVPHGSGEIALESTGNGVGNYYHRLVMRAAAGISRYRLHFYNWQDFPEYSVDLTAEQEEEIMLNLRQDFEEVDYIDDDGNIVEGCVAKYNLTPGQIAFRREKLEELDYDLRLFKQEYPMSLEECFQASGFSIFDRINFIPTEDWVKEGIHFHYLKGHPKEGSVYIIGGDVGAGTGGDNSVAEIYELETLEQVGEWVSNKHEPDQFGYVLGQLGRHYNNAFITVESNNHGLVTLEALRDGKRGVGDEYIHLPYPTYLLYRRALTNKTKAPDTVDLLATLGYRTTAKSKPFMIGRLRQYAASKLTIHSELLVDEMKTFVEHENGTLGAQDGCFDDRVMASACAVVSVEKSSLTLIQHDRQFTDEELRNKDPFLFDNILRELGYGERGRFLVPTNVL